MPTRRALEGELPANTSHFPMASTTIKSIDQFLNPNSKLQVRLPHPSLKTPRRINRSRKTTDESFAYDNFHESSQIRFIQALPTPEAMAPTTPLTALAI